MSTNLLNCIDTIWLFGRIRRATAAADRAEKAVKPVRLPPRSPSPAMLMASRDVRPLAVRAAERISEWERRHATRRQLLSLDDRMLKDIGLDRAAADAEYRKPFWRS